MSDLRPLVHDDLTERERALLGSARVDGPPAGSKQAVFAALGLAAVTTTAGAGAAVSAATTGAALTLKWVAIGVIGSGLAVGAAVALKPADPHAAARPAATALAARPAGVPVPVALDSPPAPPAPLPTAPPEPVAFPVDQAQPAAPVAPRIVRGAPLPEPAAAAPASPLPDTDPAASAPQPSAATASQARLVAELGALEVARRALASGEPAAALRSLDDYDQRFTPPLLGQEATVLRIEAWIAAGRVDIARKLAGAMLAAQPGSPYATRVRSLLANAPPGAP